MNHRYPEPGTILAERYRVGEVIGRGGMGVVLAAENTITHRRVAIKWLSSDLVDNDEAAERLVREASAAARIRHPNVVDVFDVLHDGSSIFLVMDLLHGESLEAVLHRGGIPLHELVSMLLPAMRGVAEAHRQDVVHRDIHPGNIFLSRESHDPRPVPKVLDFGISKFGNAGTAQRHLTRSNMAMGTPLYMSYEQLYSARDVDVRTDIYSFGVILYEGLTGKPPFDGESLMEVAGKITAGTPVHPKVLRPDIPQALAELVLWAIARKREDRVQTMEEFIRELEPFATAHAFRAQMTDVERPLPQVGRAERIADAIPVDDEVEMADYTVTPSAPPPLRSPRLPDVDGSRGPPITLASRPALAKEVDTLGQRTSQLAQSLRPAAQQSAARRTIVAVAAVLLVGGMVAAWKYSDRVGVDSTAGQAPSAMTAPSMVTVEPPAPAVDLPPTALLPGSAPRDSAARLVTPAAPPPPPSGPVVEPPVPPPVRPTTGPKALPKKRATQAVSHRAGELYSEDL